MDRTFEERLAEIQSKMILACMDYADNRAERVYIYASREGRCTSAHFFFKVNGRVVDRNEPGEGYDVSEDRQSACLGKLRACIREADHVCKAENDKTDIAYRYDLVYSNKRNKSDYDVAEEWFEEMQKA